MKKSFSPVTKLFLSTLAGISCTYVLIPAPSFAQLGGSDLSTGSEYQGNTNGLSSDSDGFNPLDLIHKANFGTSTWDANLQNQQLNSAAEEFKAKQERLMRGQQQGQIVPGSLNNINPSVTDPIVTPAKN